MGTAKEPTCPLCSVALVKEADVWVQTGGSNCITYSLAWVCKNCGTTWPIGLKGGGLLTSWKPVWENGQRFK